MLHGEGITPGHDAPKRMENWADDEEELETPSQNDTDKPGMSRRDFLKVAAGAAVLGAAGLAESCAPKTSEQIRSESKPELVKIEKGDNPWTLYDKSGWNDGSIEFHDFEEALKELNKDMNVDLKNLQPGDKVIIPLRNKASQ